MFLWLWVLLGMIMLSTYEVKNQGFWSKVSAFFLPNSIAMEHLLEVFTVIYLRACHFSLAQSFELQFFKWFELVSHAFHFLLPIILIIFGFVVSLCYKKSNLIAHRPTKPLGLLGSSKLWWEMMWLTETMANILIVPYSPLAHTCYTKKPFRFSFRFSFFRFVRFRVR